MQQYRGIVRVLPNSKLDWTGKIRELPSRLKDPLGWQAPQRIFVNSLSDLFHEDVRLEFIQRVFAVMRRAYWHHFQVLTKRSERLLELSPKIDWPENVWMGVSVEDAARTVRIDHLRRTGAKVKWISIEPLLEPLVKVNLQGIDWVVIGGESGSGARPMDVAWARDLRDQCRTAKITIFMKQLGEAWARATNAESRKGGEPSEWPKDLRIREYPRTLPKHNKGQRWPKMKDTGEAAA